MKDLKFDTLTTETGVVAIIEKPKPSEPKERNISGVITAPADFYLKFVNMNTLEGINFKKSMDLEGTKPLTQIDSQGDQAVLPPVGISETRGILFVSKKNNSIVYENNMFKQYENVTVSGSSVMDKKLAKLKINEDFTYSANDLAKLIRYSSSIFSDRDQALEISDSLRKLKYKVQTELIDEDDSQGNKIYNFTKQAAVELTLSFNLTSAIFEGEEKHKFKVDIMFDIRDKNISFWLESTEMEDIKIETSEKIIDREVERFGENIIIVNQ